MHEGGSSSALNTVRWIGLFAGPALALLTYALLTPAETETAGVLTEPARRVAAVTVWMATWWLTEALPLAATALVPVAVMPLLGVMPVKDVAAPYASDIIFLFAGGLLLGIAMERWGLHRRIALITISIVGTRPNMLVGGFMLATAVMSAWVSNTATAVMMLPIALSVITLVFNRLSSGEEVGEGGALHEVTAGAPGRNFALCLLLGVAYAASIGGIATLIGTPPNALLAQFVKNTAGIDMTFGLWLRIGLPFVIIFLPLTWLILTRLLFPIQIEEVPGGREFILGELRSLGRMSAGEWGTFVIFCLAALLWVREPLLQIAQWVLRSAGAEVDVGSGLVGLASTRLSDAGIAVIAALLLFVVPVNPRRREFVMDWAHASRLPIEILVLFGGGLALAAAISATGLDAYIGSLFGILGGVPPLLIVLVVVGVMIFLTELTSNTAVTATFLPILFAASHRLEVHPFLLLIPSTIAASCAFMLPMATPPNALVFASGHVTIPLMARAGLLLNLAGVVVATLLVYTLGGWLLGIDLMAPMANPAAD